VGHIAVTLKLNMRTLTVSASLIDQLLVAAVASSQVPGSQPDRETRIGAGQSCPSGTTEIRPGICRAPEMPAPSILDYRPRSTLVTPAHPVARAKYPAIDFHGHPRDMITSAEGLTQLATSLDSLNVRAMVAADNLSGERLQRAVAAIRASPRMRDRVRVFAGIDFQNVGSPGWAAKVVAQLEADIAAAETQVRELERQLASPDLYKEGEKVQQTTKAFEDAKVALKQLYEHWEEAVELNDRTRGR